MRSILTYIIIAAATTAGLGYVHNTDPEMIEEIVLKVDVLGITEVGAQERDRISQITSLTIPFEKKQVLMNRTIFMGASRQMVFLALGQPNSLNKNPVKKAAGARIQEEWVYFFKDDQRPTVLQFQKETLVGAYKTSPLNVQNQESATMASSK